MRPVFLIFLPLLLLGTALPVAAERVLIQLQAAADPWPPYIDDQHPHGGISVQLANAALQTQGYQVINRMMPWARALEETRQGRIDLVLDAWWSQDRSRDFLYSRPYTDGPVKFIKRKQYPFEFRSMADLNGLTIGLVRHYAYDEELLKARNYTPFEVTDFMQSIEMLIKGRIHLAIENELVARARIKTEAPALAAQIDFGEEPLSNNYVYIISGYKNPRHVEIIAAFNRGLDIILNNGTYAHIMQENGLTVPKMFQSM